MNERLSSAEIEDIITNKLGIKDQQSYKAYHEKKMNETLSMEELNLLSPDRVNSRDFWQVADKLFGTDRITNCQYAEKAFDRMFANRSNNHLAKFTGPLVWAEGALVAEPPNTKILEIGAGLGAFKNYIEATQHYIQYVGVDAYPSAPDILACKEPDGSLPDEVLAQQFSVVYSSNVFQHLSDKQRETYIRQSYEVLKPKGALTLNLMISNGHIGYRGEDGRRYLGHYGQYTPMPTMDEFSKMYNPYFYVYYYNVRMIDSFVGFFLVKKEEQEKK